MLPHPLHNVDQLPQTARAIRTKANTEPSMLLDTAPNALPDSGAASRLRPHEGQWSLCGARTVLQPRQTRAQTRGCSTVWKSHSFAPQCLQKSMVRQLENFRHRLQTGTAILYPLVSARSNLFLRSVNISPCAVLAIQELLWPQYFEHRPGSTIPATNRGFSTLGRQS